MACPRCGFANPEGFAFCGKCGASLSQPASDTKYGSVDRYTPTYLAEKILTSKSALEGERKQVTVLFADLKGSMELLADRDPEDARKLLDPVLERMMEAVHRYEGTVNQVMGDGIMALFGAPLAHEDHAVRACYAALRMQAAIRQYTEEVRRSHGIEVQIRVGLNSGDVVVRSIGSDLRMDYTAVGQTTHLAARMEQLATPGSIRLTAETLRLAEGYVEVKPLGPIPVKGLPEPVEAYEATGAGTVRTRLQAAVARGLSRFVGRDAETDGLERARKLAGEGHGQLVAVVGVAGVGKSRLFYEFTRSPRARQWLIVESGSVSYGRATAYLPVIDLLKGYFKIEDRDDHREIREKVAGKVLVLDRALEPALPALLALLDVPVDDARWQSLDPPQRRQRTLEAVTRLLLRETEVQPVLAVFEDLHWIDSETQALLDGLVESLPTVRMLLLVNYRPEYRHGWENTPGYAQLGLDTLASESAGALLSALLGNDATLAPLEALLTARTGGNPLFLEESVRTLVETKALVGERGAYRLAQPLRAIQVPATVQSILAARIDRLPPDEKRLLQSAAVIGKDVPFGLLRALAEDGEDDLRRRLAHLQIAEFLHEASLFPDPEYTFQHALTHEVAYGSLLQDRRRALHGAVVGAIERLYPDRLTEQVERLAHHAFRGEMWERAVTYLRQAGTKALARSANREAVDHFERALAALAHLPDDHVTRERAVDLRLDLRNALYPLGESDRIADYLREAEGLAQALDDPRRLAWVSAYISVDLLFKGEYARALESARRALVIAEGLGDAPLLAVANYYTGLACYVQGDYRGASESFRRNVTALVGDRSRERVGLPGFPAVLSRALLTMALADTGAFPEGIRCGDEAIRLAEAVDHPFSLSIACFGLGYLHLRHGDVARATSILERGVGVCRVANMIWFRQVASVLASAYAFAGRVGEALPLFEEAMGQTASGVAWRPFSLASLGETCWLAGRVDDALDSATRALTASREHGERGNEAYVLRLLGEIATHGDPPDREKGEGHYRRGLTLAEELGMRPLVAHCHAGLGRLYRRTGRGPAEEHLATARRLYRDMGMGSWLERMEGNPT